MKGLLFAALLAPSLLAQGPVRPARIPEGALRGHMAFLADDLLEGRGTGQRGGDVAVAYLEAQLAASGVQPAAAGAYRQPVHLTGARALAEQSSLRFVGSGGSLSFACGPEIIFNTTTGQDRLPFDAPLVWVGYGIQAPEERWDDFQGADLRGKLLVMLAGEPVSGAQAPGRFGGAAMTYYGRWTYKFEEARRQGAVGALLVHRDPAAAYGWNVVVAGGAGEKFHLRQEEGGGNAFQGWITEANGRQLLAEAGMDLDRLIAAAEAGPTAPVALPLRLQGTLVNQVRPLTQWNVAGLVPGTDPVLREEVVVYAAHWDHLGKADNGSFFNGAVDDASGCAAVLAMAAWAARNPAPRSQMFVFFCGEEQGLLGSRAYVASPLWPLAKTVAVLNLDCMNFSGPTRDLGLQGVECLPFGDTARQVARDLGFAVRPEPPDALGLYFRADHWSFVKAKVPAFTPTMVMGAGPGWDFVHGEERQRAEAYGRHAYHTTKDTYDPSWNLQGMVDQAEYLLSLGQALARPAAPRGRR